MDERGVILQPQPADVQDRDGAPVVLRLSRCSSPFIAKAFADRDYASERPATATSITTEIVRRPSDRIGFAVHPRRWVVERFSAWISRNRWLSKDPEATLTSHRLRHPLRDRDPGQHGLGTAHVRRRLPSVQPHPSWAGMVLWRARQRS